MRCKDEQSLCLPKTEIALPKSSQDLVSLHPSQSVLLLVSRLSRHKDGTDHIGRREGHERAVTDRTHITAQAAHCPFHQRPGLLGFQKAPLPCPCPRGPPSGPTSRSGQSLTNRPCQPPPGDVSGGKPLGPWAPCQGLDWTSRTPLRRDEPLNGWLVICIIHLFCSFLDLTGPAPLNLITLSTIPPVHHLFFYPLRSGPGLPVSHLQHASVSAPDPSAPTWVTLAAFPTRAQLST